MNSKQLDKIFNLLFPIFRSITGNGYLKSLQIFKKYMNLKLIKYRSRKKVFDWVVPDEWVIKDAHVIYKGKKIIDIKKNNLHVVNYSSRVDKTISLDKLNDHLFSSKKSVNHIPYVTSYYKNFWGFCIEEKKRKKLKKGLYKVFVNSKFKKGNVINGLSKLKGKSNKIVLLTSYLCHPSMANNELSGPLTLLGLYEKIKNWKVRNMSYFFLINPETIGSICFLSDHYKILKKNLHSGMVLTCLGGFKKKLSYKKSRFGKSPLDKIFQYYENRKKFYLRNFDPTSGSDERQYCAGELNLPFGQIARTIYGEYKEYHTSGDNKKFMKISQIEKSIEELETILKINDCMFPLKRFSKYGELQLGKRSLYPNLNHVGNRNKQSTDKLIDNREQLNVLLSLLSYADNTHDIVDIANKTNLSLEKLPSIVNFALEKKLLK